MSFNRFHAHVENLEVAPENNVFGGRSELAYLLPCYKLGVVICEEQRLQIDRLGGFLVDVFYKVFNSFLVIS